MQYRTVCSEINYHMKYMYFGHEIFVINCFLSLFFSLVQAVS